MKLLGLVTVVLLAHLAMIGWLLRAPELATRQLKPLQVQVRQAQAQPPQVITRSTRPAWERTRAKTVPKAAPTNPGATLTEPVTNGQAQPAMLSAPQTDALSAVQSSAPATGQGAAQTASVTAATPAAAVLIERAKSAQASTPPSADAHYLRNPPPAYPPLSLRRGEQGTVLVRVLISNQGQPLHGELAQSSGFDRLDQAALQAVMQWRYIAAQSNGVAIDKWFTVPVRFRLDEK